MEIIKLNLKGKSYNIIVGFNILNSLPKFIDKLDMGTDTYIITNATIRNKYGMRLERILKSSGYSVRFKNIPDTEEGKSLKIATSVIEDMASYDKGRRIFVIAFGGGVVGDLAGFAASIYKRGIPYIQIPTTLLAQVDSSIGGKTAVDLVEAKNLVGAFYQPQLVLSDVEFLESLGPRQIRSGLAEVIKYAIIKDREFFSFLEQRYKDALSLNPGVLKFIVSCCSKIKSRIVGIDEREEKGLRTILNFGHTVGHAIEAAARYKTYTHGEAVALGMLVSSRISRNLKFINDEIYCRIENLIKAVGLPLHIKKLSLNSIIDAHYRDKKFIGRRNRFVLIQGLGRTKIVENVPLAIIKEAIKNRF